MTPEYVASAGLYDALGGAQRNIFSTVAPNDQKSFPYSVYTTIYNQRTNDKDYSQDLTNITYEVRVYGLSMAQVEEEGNRMRLIHGTNADVSHPDHGVIGRVSIIYDNEYNEFDQTSLLFSKVMYFKVRSPLL